MKTIDQEQFTKVIECPECACSMKLYVFPSMWAGIQECENPDCAVYDTCQHVGTHTEDSEINVCDTCGVQVEEVYHYDY